MKILITGASGLLGTQLQRVLKAARHEVITVGRKRADILWNVDRKQLDASKLEGLDAAIHLAGENVGEGRWTRARKERILDSRVDGTTLLCKAFAKLKRKPRVLVCASATGYYGDREDEELDERSSPGIGFLATVCRAWEEACVPAIEAGVRVVNTRFGVILSPKGGALQKMLWPFRLCLGSNIGTGRQWFSWVSIDDAVGAVQFALSNETLSGPVNVTAPNPVRQKEFARVLGKVLLRPTIRFLPWAATALPLMLLLGDMANEALLAGQKVLPRRLLDAGFQFKHPELEAALRHVLKSKGVVSA